MKNIFCIIVFTGLISSYGCGSKSASMKPDVSYGNPSYRHIKDLPRVNDEDFTNQMNKKKQTVKITGEDFEQSGDTFLVKHDYFMAYMQYEKALWKNKDNIRVEYKKGLALMGGGKKDEAQKQFEMVLKKKPKFALAYEAMGKLYLNENNYFLAAKKFQEAVSLEPLLWRSYNYLGNIYALEGKNTAAIKEFLIALTIKPSTGFILNNLGLSQYSLGQNKEAVASFYLALENGYVKPKVYNNLGVVLTDMEFYEEALDAFEKGGNKSVALNNLGVGYLKNGKVKEAVLYFKKAIEISPVFYVTASENLKKCKKIQKNPKR